MNFVGKSVVVTGGASGMGAASAKLFAEAGADVTIVDRNRELTAERAVALGVTPLIGDVADSTFCEEVMQQVVAHTGRLDVLVNAAGTIVRADALQTSDEEWLRVMNVNTNGVFYMSRAAIRVMKAAGSDAPARIEPTSSTLAGSAQIMPVMNTVWPNGIPASTAKPQKPTKALIRMMAGKEAMPRTPLRNQWTPRSVDGMLIRAC